MTFDPTTDEAVTPEEATDDVVAAAPVADEATEAVEETAEEATKETAE